MYPESIFLESTFYKLCNDEKFTQTGVTVKKLRPKQFLRSNSKFTEHLTWVGPHFSFKLNQVRLGSTQPRTCRDGASPNRYSVLTTEASWRDSEPIPCSIRSSTFTGSADRHSRSAPPPSLSLSLPPLLFRSESEQGGEGLWPLFGGEKKEKKGNEVGRALPPASDAATPNWTYCGGSFGVVRCEICSV